MEISYFVFDLDQHLSAIEATYVEEVLALPELILIPDAPLGIVGVLDLRGDVLPVLDLRQRTETLLSPYQLSDRIIVLNQDQLRIGIIVNTVQGLREIPSQDITSERVEHTDWLKPDARHLVSGMISGEEAIFTLSEPKGWFNVNEIQQFVSVTSFLVTEIQSKTQADDNLSGEQLPDNSSSTAKTPFCPTATPEEQLIFRQRAEQLRRSLDENQSEEETKTLVVIALDNHLFGIDSQVVREFITIRQATPIPCCPPYIIGNINLHGEILTIVDICQPLNLSSKSLTRNPKAVVFEFKETAVGVVVDGILDAMFSINPTEIQTIPAAMLAVKSDYIQGIASYNDQKLHILNLPTLLLGDELVVNANL
ncbi:MAG: chemotaxis protein CheW [Leptolyngbya sp. SIO1D8]|nr:chemotaxis protein CheW [Leptolyngbya sp. SIO1D8]